MSTHIPGPWEIVPADHENSFIRPVGRKAVICETYTFVGDDAWERSNARLLAAAPDLLAALKDLLEAVGGEESTDIWCRDARAAIAKAEGTGP